MNKKTVKIGLVGHSFSRGNFGLCALAFGELSVIETACAELGLDYQVTCFETGINMPCNDNPKVKLEQYNLKDIRSTARQFSTCDLIFDITGGDSFSDIYGVKLFIVHCFIKLAVLLSKTPYICAPQTYGPFKHWWVKKLANYYISKSKGVYGRDKNSSSSLSDNNQKRIKCVADLGFFLPFIQLPKFIKPTVGFNVNGLIYQNENLLGKGNNYRELCNELIKFVKSIDYDVVLVPHVVGVEPGIDNDYYVCKELAAKHNLPEPIFFSDPKEVKGYISKCHFFIGSRMHATIGAVSSDVPTLPLAYSRKFEGVYDTIGYNYTLDLKVSKKEEILDRIRELLGEKCNVVKEDVAKANNLVVLKTRDYILGIEAVLKEVCSL